MRVEPRQNGGSSPVFKPLPTRGGDPEKIRNPLLRLQGSPYFPELTSALARTIESLCEILGPPV